MKKLFVTLIIAVTMPCICFAENKKDAPIKKAAEIKSVSKEEAPVKKTSITEEGSEVKTEEDGEAAKKEKAAPVKLEIMRYSGKYHSFAPGNKGQNISPLFMIELDDKSVMMFKLDDKTAVSGSSREKLGETKKGTKVAVDYVMKPVEGITAISIKLQ